MPIGSHHVPDLSRSPIAKEITETFCVGNAAYDRYRSRACEGRHWPPGQDAFHSVSLSPVDYQGIYPANEINRVLAAAVKNLRLPGGGNGRGRSMIRGDGRRGGGQRLALTPGHPVLGIHGDVFGVTLKFG